MRAFLDRYGVNLLALPRRDIACLELFRRDASGRVSTAFALDSVIDPSLGQLDLREGEPLAPLKDTRSTKRDLRLGVGLLEGFLAALGAPALIDSVSAGFAGSKIRSLAFEFRDATRDSVDPGRVADELIGRHFTASPMILRGRRVLRDHRRHPQSFADRACDNGLRPCAAARR